MNHVTQLAGRAVVNLEHLRLVVALDVNRIASHLQPVMFAFAIAHFEWQLAGGLTVFAEDLDSVLKIAQDVHIAVVVRVETACKTPPEFTSDTGFDRPEFL